MSLQDNIQYTRTIEEYKKTGLPFSLTPTYAAKQRFYNKTRQSKVHIVEIRNVERIKDSSGVEWLNWSETIRRADGWENMKHDTTPDMGISQRGEPTYGGKYDDEGNLVKKITGTGEVVPVFNTLFNMDNLEKLHKFTVPAGEKKPTEYMVKNQFGGHSIRVESYEDFKDGKFDDLFKTGKKADSSKVTKKGGEQ